MSVSAVTEAVLSAGLLSGLLSEPEEHRELARKELEYKLRELAHKLLELLRKSFASSPPPSAREAVERAEKVLEEFVQGDEVRELVKLLENIDVENFVKEQIEIFSKRVNDLYVEVYRRFHGQKLAEVEPVLMTLTAAEMLFHAALRNAKLAHVARRTAALLTALAVLLKLGWLDLVKQLPTVAEDILTEYFVHL